MECALSFIMLFFFKFFLVFSFLIKNYYAFVFKDILTY